MNWIDSIHLFDWFKDKKHGWEHRKASRVSLTTTIVLFAPKSAKVERSIEYQLTCLLKLFMNRLTLIFYYLLHVRLWPSAVFQCTLLDHGIHSSYSFSNIRPLYCQFSPASGMVERLSIIIAGPAPSIPRYILLSNNVGRRILRRIQCDVFGVYFVKQ